MRRIRVTVAYDGTEFYGWQVQPGLPTIQGTLETILSGIEGKHVNVVGSGRTDAGVHALAQVAAFSIQNPIPPDNLRKAINRLLPPAIRIRAVEEVSPEFHPRYDAIAKTYEYRIAREEICLPFDRRYVHHYPYPLDEAAMMSAAPLLEGEHDFTRFSAADERDQLGNSKVRHIYSSRLERTDHRLVYRVRGSGFLKHMVRNVVGVLIEVGKGNVDDAALLRRFDPDSDIAAGPTAPAQGLFLISVAYPAHLLR